MHWFQAQLCGMLALNRNKKHIKQLQFTNTTTAILGTQAIHNVHYTYILWKAWLPRISKPQTPLNRNFYPFPTRFGLEGFYKKCCSVLRGKIVLKSIRNNGKLVRFPEYRSSGLLGFLYNENRRWKSGLGQLFSFEEIPVYWGSVFEGSTVHVSLYQGTLDNEFLL